MEGIVLYEAIKLRIGEYLLRVRTGSILIKRLLVVLLTVFGKHFIKAKRKWERAVENTNTNCE